jgi:hypothetical protein
MQSEISLVLLWQNAISRKIKNRSERWNQGAAFLLTLLAALED